MKLSFKTRLHEWLADRISWVQYPNVKPASGNAKLRRLGIRWEHKMPLGARINLILMSLALLLVAIPLLAVTLVVAYAVLSAILGF